MYPCQSITVKIEIECRACCTILYACFFQRVCVFFFSFKFNLVEEGQVVEKTLAGGESLDTAAESSNHSKTTVLNLGLSEVQYLIFGLSRSKVKRVEGSSRVEALVEVGLGVTVDLGATDKKNFEKGKLGDGERKVEVKVAGAVELDLASLVPWDASAQLSNDGTEGGKHSPAAVDELALAEALEAEDFRVRGKGVGGVKLINVLIVSAYDPTSLIDGGVLVELIDVELEVLSRLRETKRVESTVSRKGAIQPLGALSVRKPERVGISLRSLRLYAGPPRMHRCASLDLAQRTGHAVYSSHAGRAGGGGAGGAEAGVAGHKHAR